MKRGLNNSEEVKISSDIWNRILLFWLTELKETYNAKSNESKQRFLILKIWIVFL